MLNLEIMIKKYLGLLVILGFCEICLAQDFWLKQDTPEGFHVRDMVSNIDSWIYLGTNDGVYVKEAKKYVKQYFSNNNGENIVKLGLENTILSVAINNQNDILAGSGPIYYSQDAGASWNEKITPSSVNTIFINDNKLIYGYWGGIYLSENFGFDWDPVLNTDLSQLITCIVQKDDSTYFAGSTAFMGGGGVYRSFDSGDNWFLVGLLDYYIQSLAIDSNGTLFAASIGNEGIGIYKSNDDGENWIPLKTNVFVSSILITIEDIIYIGCTNEHGTQGGVFRSYDYGVTWEIINSGLNDMSNQDIEGLCLSKNGYLYCYGEHLHRSAQPVIESIFDCNFPVEDISVFPNPANDYIYITLKNKNTYINNIKIDIFDSLGRCLYSDNTNHILIQPINISNFANGLYSVRIKYNNTQTIKQFFKLNQ
jgi:photosystem II stability/assembly factor-like uncharacterized protein